MTMNRQDPCLNKLWLCVFAAAYVVWVAGCQDRVAEPPKLPATLAKSGPIEALAPDPMTTPGSDNGTLGWKFERPKSRKKTGENLSRDPPKLVDAAAQAGILHTYLNGAVGKLMMVEATGGGCGWIDFDRDGNWDLYLNQGGNPAAATSAERPPHQLYRNVGAGRFELATAACGIDEHGYGQGVAIGDFDNDGFDDIYVTNVGGDSLYQNCGDGTFRNVTPGSGLHQKTWSTSAAWGDIDLDGDLDLYVCTYAVYDPFYPRLYYNSRGLPAICQPDVMEPLPDECYLNQGDGTFRPIAAERGLAGPGNMALGVAIADFNNDGWPDLFVANDARANFLFINDGTAHFHELGAVLGCAVNSNGNPQANMGIAVGDYDRNGWLDLFVTHFAGEWNTLYRNRGVEGFQDISGPLGLVPTRPNKVGWGTIMADLNYDGFAELFVANGHVEPNRGEHFEFEMICQLYTWQGQRWVEQTAQAGDFFERRMFGRAVATADYDNDGDIDLLIVPQNSPVALLNNQSRLGNWLKLEFIGRRSNRNGIGTRVTTRFGEHTIMQEMAGGTSYCATHQSALFFGLGEWSGGVELEVRWPCGTVETHRDVSVNQALLMLEPLEPDR
jgi:hypothetical protein